MNYSALYDVAPYLCIEILSFFLFLPIRMDTRLVPKHNRHFLICDTLSLSHLPALLLHCHRSDKHCFPNIPFLLICQCFIAIATILCIFLILFDHPFYCTRMQIPWQEGYVNVCLLWHPQKVCGTYAHKNSLIWIQTNEAWSNIGNYDYSFFK